MERKDMTERQELIYDAILEAVDVAYETLDPTDDKMYNEITNDVKMMLAVVNGEH